MSEVEKKDLERIHERIDDLVTANTAKVEKQDLVPINNQIEKLVDSTTKTAVDIGIIKTKLQTFNIPERPCKVLEEHLNNHKENNRIWKRPIASTVIDLIKIGAVFLIGWFWSKRS